MVPFAKMIPGRISKRWVVALTLLVVYLPYIWLFLLEWNWPLMRIWPFVPGVALGALIPPSFPHSWLPKGPDAGFLFYSDALGHFDFRNASLETSVLADDGRTPPLVVRT